MQKKEARAYALSLRKNKDKHLLENYLVEEIIKSNVLAKYNHIGIYYPIGDEMSVLRLLSYYPGKSFYLPITKDNLSFIEYKLNDELYDGPFHTKEPKGHIIDRDLIECFIIPCVAISKDNKRLGYGKGYYDKYLAGYKGLKIGVSYKEALLDIEMDSFDLGLDLVFVG